ncbi:hypothetical protein, partial [Streptomyces sp. AS58]|uniref:hypothetical protein n=1 Tax=Streptomyces sp. AS58 TaxID=1519489 RepID=UPI000A7551CE
HSKLITSLVRDAHTTSTSPSPESNTLMIGRPLVATDHEAHMRWAMQLGPHRISPVVISDLVGISPVPANYRSRLAGDC